jgi:hypothetical protein
MKKYILLLTLLSTPCFATTQLQIHALKDNAVVVGYNIRTWNGPKQGMIDTKYTVAEAQAKFPTFLSKSESGTDNNTDVITVIYNDDGSVYKVEFHASTPTVFERTVKAGEALSAQAATEATATKDDVETKTGKDIGGGEVKPK